MCFYFHIPDKYYKILNVHASVGLNGWKYMFIRYMIVQGGRSWQPLGERKNGHKFFVRRALAIFATI